MDHLISSDLKKYYRIFFSVSLVLAVLIICFNQSYLLFHTVIELLSIVVAFTVFVITWNAKKILQNQYLYFVGIAYLFIGGMDLLHTLTFKGMNILDGQKFYANQFWIATRGLEALVLVVGFYFLKSKKKINPDLLFTGYLVITGLISLSILYWEIFPICYIEGIGQTIFKIIAEYVIIAILLLASYFLVLRKSFFDPFAFKLLLFSLTCTILSEFCFTLYFENTGLVNTLGHIFKLVSFYLIYKANIETGFTKPTTLLFKSINESEYRYRTLANNLPVHIFRFDKYFNCTYSNEKETRQSTKALFNEIQLLLANAEELTNEALKSDITLWHDGSKQVYSIEFIIENQDSLTGEQTYLVLCQDITQLKLAEEQLIELNATKDKFFSIIAHDLKNPFTTILASNELIYKSAPKLGVEKIQNLALRSHEAAKSAYALLDNLLNWSMIQTGALKPHPEVIEIDHLIAVVVKNINPATLAKGIELKHPESTQLKCYADANMLSTVLRNLLSNAIKFSFPDTLIHIFIIEEEQYIKFAVADEGVGIDETNLQQLLASNTIVSKDGTAKEKGTGLGLQLCKDFIRLNKGTFNVISKIGEGSTFEFWLPKIH